MSLRAASKRRSALRRSWFSLLLACLAAVTALETLLLRLGTAFLTSGFNAARVDSPFMLLAFLAASAALDLALLLGIWLLVVPVARLGASRLQLFCIAGLGAIGIPLGLTAARYNLHAVLGDMASLVLMRQFSRLDSSAMIETAVGEMPALGLAVLAALAGAGVLLALARRVEGKRPDLAPALSPPSVRVLGGGFALFALLGALLLWIAPTRAAALHYGLERKTSAILLTRLVEALSDLDRDGFGALARPPDAAPFDAAIHPYAVDVPDNGVDENGLAGDHPAARADAGSPDALPAASEARPHLLLIYLESFRADLLGQRRDGREITPFLNRLAAEGVASQQAFTHSPWTLDSRAQLFGGRIWGPPGQTTLVDDFHARGYTVAHFSGQDDSYGDIRVLGAERADVFYDARQDLARRTSRSTAPVSLQVSWKTLLERLSGFLEQVDPERPLFLYVNVVDSHYPYSHAELDPIFSQTPLERDEIRVHNAERVRESYANAAANVDRAVERIVAAFRQRFGSADHAILVTADHGQALYDQGLLGHGQSIDRVQTQVPFILWGLGGEWPEPLAPTDVRPLLQRNLGRDRDGGHPRARLVPRPERTLLQYCCALERPAEIGLRGIGEVARYDFRRDQLELLAPDGQGLGASESERDAAFLAVVQRWEEAQRSALGPPSPPAGGLAGAELHRSSGPLRGDRPSSRSASPAAEAGAAPGGG